MTDLPFLDSPSYKWIFVGGKGGVGKTTTACAIAVALARSRKSVLIVSTDPASNLDDTFQQHFSSEPTRVQGFTNLWAQNPRLGDPEHDPKSLTAFPGVDEASVLTSVFAAAGQDEYDVVVFDTAPTGHTMRLLAMPEVVDNLFDVVGGFGSVVMNELAQAVGVDGSSATRDISDLQGMVESIRKRLQNSMETTFVCVTLPQFSPLWETERLIEFLTEKKVEMHTIVVNQIIPEDKVGECARCKKRLELQQKILRDINEAFDDCRIIEVPELDEDIRGVEAVQRFATHLEALYAHK